MALRRMYLETQVVRWQTPPQPPNLKVSPRPRREEQQVKVVVEVVVNLMAGSTGTAEEAQTLRSNHSHRNSSLRELP